MVSDRTVAPSVRICDKDVPFKMDTGAQVTAISEELYKTLGRIELKKPCPTYMSVMGQLTTQVSCRENRSKQMVFVVRDLQVNLLGLPALTALQLLHRADAVTDSANHDIIERFPNVFKGLGNIGNTLSI